MKNLDVLYSIDEDIVALSNDDLLSVDGGSEISDAFWKGLGAATGAMYSASKYAYDAAQELFSFKPGNPWGDNSQKA